MNDQERFIHRFRSFLNVEYIHVFLNIFEQGYIEFHHLFGAAVENLEYSFFSPFLLLPVGITVKMGNRCPGNNTGYLIAVTPCKDRNTTSTAVAQKENPFIGGISEV